MVNEVWKMGARHTISMTCWRTISSIIPVVSGDASAVSPETYIILIREGRISKQTGSIGPSRI